MGFAQYIKNFALDRDVASVTPTSQIAVQKVCTPIDFSRPLKVVEFGPGGGVFTEYLLANLSEDSAVIAIEKNPGFAKALNRKFSDRRLSIVEGDVRNVSSIVEEHGWTNADYMLSGIPFSFLTPSEIDTLLQTVENLLRPGGQFLIYQFYFPPFVNASKLRQSLEKNFPSVDMGIEVRNVPPLCFFHCTASK